MKSGVNSRTAVAPRRTATASSYVSAGTGRNGLPLRSRKVGNDADEGRADVLELLRDLVLHPLHERDDGDDGGHADHHAEDGEDRRILLAPMARSAILTFSKTRFLGLRTED